MSLPKGEGATYQIAGVTKTLANPRPRR